jgi:hypothetical protein
MVLLELLVFFALLFGAGWVFGRPLMSIPLLLTFIPILWQVSTQLNKLHRQFETLQLNQVLNDQVLNVYLALSLGLGMILLVIALVWSWTFPLSAFLFPLLVLAVYTLGPERYLTSHLPFELEPASLQNLTFFMIAASLGILSYALPMMLGLRAKPIVKPPTLNAPTLDGR